jgi:hypothetical protein
MSTYILLPRRGLSKLDDTQNRLTLVLPASAGGLAGVPIMIKGGTRLQTPLARA